jgi:hypothetical protein
MAQKARRWLWNGARNIPARALKGGEGRKKIVFYTYEATNLLKIKEAY